MNTSQAAISPSRANDFKQCPLKFRYRVIDAIPEPPSKEALRGTLVHSVLEHLYEVDALARTENFAQSLLIPRWEAHLRKNPKAMDLFETQAECESWLESARPLISHYFALENPQFLEPKARESFVNAELPQGLAIRGIIDRIDEAPDGALRVVDYKTGKSPQPRYQDSAIFQMRFYATALYFEQKRLPARTQLIYLGDGRILTYDPSMADVAFIESSLMNLWSAISERLDTKDFEPKQGPLCGWCYFKDLCPAFGGQMPEINESGIEKLRTAFRK
ncbi:putative RecB family exonuclease [Arcanobacterium pluranimalium]|uniref:RecB family exonuclease n=1 Tax=Arcanobacterium pluranimalium TaxID=108028 RepID=UPI001956436C|nr:PD-(D/E)XK nuclease family protein [Arcanobacterium pluranimalium]MBM7825369.1 putative RecB family exonuclease [Arcanobacterium pluranimalium]